jgi:hypothetical protein
VSVPNGTQFPQGLLFQLFAMPAPWPSGIDSGASQVLSAPIRPQGAHVLPLGAALGQATEVRRRSQLGRRPKTSISALEPMYTLPLATVGTVNLTARPVVSVVAIELSHSSWVRSVASKA